MPLFLSPDMLCLAKRTVTGPAKRKVTGRGKTGKLPIKERWAVM